MITKHLVSATGEERPAPGLDTVTLTCRKAGWPWLDQDRAEWTTNGAGRWRRIGGADWKPVSEELEAILVLARTTVLSADGAKQCLDYLKALRAPWEVKVDLVDELVTAANYSGNSSLLPVALELVKKMIGGEA
jgi:hypothetical protein